MSATLEHDPMQRPMTKRQGVVITAEQHDQLNRISAATGKSKNSLIRSAIARLIEDVGEVAA